MHRLLVRIHSGVLFLAAALWAAGASAIAQTAAIRGTVVDGLSGVPVEFANVFLAQTTSGTSTNVSGAFVLANIPPGSYELIVSRVGYVRSSKRIDVAPGTGRPLRIELQPKSFESEEVEILGVDPGEWRRLLGFFTTAFLGRTENASSCTIVNPLHLDFRYNADTRILTASCDTTLVIENHALGYRIDCEIDLFEWDVVQDIGRYIVYPRFLPLPVLSPEDSANRATRRERTYRGSFKHFLRSMISETADEEMFAMYTGSLEHLSGGNGEAASPSEVAMTPDTLLGGYRLAFSGWLRVDYCGRLPKERSFLLLRSPYARVDRHGNIITPLAVQVAGLWGRSRIADMVPLY
jgi:hypothetical protein